MRTLLILPFLIFYFGYSQESEFIKFEQDNYSIEYPENWSLNKSKVSGTEFFIISENRGTFPENVNFMIQDLSGYNMELNAYIEYSINQINNDIKNGQILKSLRKTKDGTEYHEIWYKGNMNNTDLNWIAYSWVQNNKAYLLTFTSLSSEYSENYKIGKRIIDSFTIYMVH